MSWRKYAADAEMQFNPQANPAIDAKAEFALRAELSASARKRMRSELDVRYGPGARQLLDIFPAGDGSAPIHVYIHGGYWRMGDKGSQSLLAEPFVNAGIACAFPTYDLCPQLSLDQIVAEVLDAIEWIFRNGARIGDPNRIYLSGSSVGAHLCAMALAHDWPSRGLPADFIKGATLLTGIYDLEPVLEISINELVHLTRDRVRDNSPIYHPPRRKLPLLMEVGGEEPPGWQAQTLEFADICRAAGCDVQVMVLPGETHFSILRSLGQADHPLTKAMIAQMSRQ